MSLPPRPAQVRGTAARRDQPRLGRAVTIALVLALPVGLSTVLDEIDGVRTAPGYVTVGVLPQDRPRLCQGNSCSRERFNAYYGIDGPEDRILVQRLWSRTFGDAPFDPKSGIEVTRRQPCPPAAKPARCRDDRGL